MRISDLLDKIGDIYHKEGDIEIFCVGSYTDKRFKIKSLDFIEEDSVVIISVEDGKDSDDT